MKVTALTEPYLKSHQPEGPWPDGPTPADMVQRVRALLHEKARTANVKPVVDEHTAILEALRARDPVAADGGPAGLSRLVAFDAVSCLCVAAAAGGHGLRAAATQRALSRAPARSEKARGRGHRMLQCSLR